jgi:peroxiredoxin Q/BCP
MTDTILAAGQTAPDFTLPSAQGDVTLSDFRGKKVLLYFYPKDMTPTCTEQACLFRDSYGELTRLGVAVIGVSPDPVKRHAQFAVKYGLPFLLLSDEDHKAAEKYGVWRMKKLYGREYMGIVRSTFLIDENGVIARSWDNVRLKGHLEEVMEAIKGMDR